MKLPNIMVGRDKDLEALKMQFDTLLEGRQALAVVAGDTGIGKTTLVKKALADLALVNGTCIYGKFEQYNSDQTYLAIIQILEQITQHMLTLPEEKLHRLRKELVQKLGRDKALITWMVPQTRGILGQLRSIKVNDYQKLQIRLEKSLQALIAVAARGLYPLVIAVDDLQWADQPSWQVLKALYDSLSDHPLYLILVYKNDLQEYREKVTAMLADLAGNEPVWEIKPEALPAEDTTAMLAGVFDGNFDNFHELAQLVYRKTAGNPLYIQQMLNLFLENKGIYYDPETKE